MEKQEKKSRETLCIIFMRALRKSHPQPAFMPMSYVGLLGSEGEAARVKLKPRRLWNRGWSSANLMGMCAADCPEVLSAGTSPGSSRRPH